MPDACRSEALSPSFRARCREAREPDLLPPLVRILDLALRRLGDLGSTDEACRLAAEGWALLEPEREGEARRLNGTLHYLTRAARRP